MTKETSNYSPRQTSLILAAVRENGNVANGEVAKALSENPEMRAEGDSQNRSPRSIIAKMRRMADTEGFIYERKAPTTKDGKPVTKKTDLVKRLADATGIAVAKLDGLAVAPKSALDLIVAAVESMRDDEDERSGTEG